MTQCDCNERVDTKIDSMWLFDELNEFFTSQVANGTFTEVEVQEPNYVFDGDSASGRVEWFADKWYRCNSCGCLWEFGYPDFPTTGYANKLKDR